MPKHHFGWMKQPEDSRDLKYTVSRRITAILPPMADLSAGMGPQLNQGELGSCGPNTADELIEFDQRVEGMPVVSASRLFIYYTTRTLMGTIKTDSGVDNRTLLKALNKTGFCPETSWPYDVAKFTSKPPTACFKAALKNKIVSYAAVAQDLAQMKGCIVSGFPFMFGFSCFAAIQSAAVAKTGIVPDPAPGEKPIGGHDVTFIGYNDSTQMFKFRNHWLNANGTPWGDKGYGYISYKYATDPTLASDFWVINAVPAAA